MTHTTLRILPLMALAVLLPVGPASAAASAAVPTTAGQSTEGSPVARPADTGATESTVNTAVDRQAATPKLDLDTLIERLKQTQAIGVLTKLVLRSDVNDLIDEVRRYKKTKGSPRQLERIKAHFNGLLLKVLALLDSDPKLARDIQSARDSLWQHLMEVKT